MTTYFFGIVEFGKFKVTAELAKATPLAIIQRVDVVKEFDNPEDAWQFYIEGKFDSYVGLDAKDENGVQYELVFKQHR